MYLKGSFMHKYVDQMYHANNHCSQGICVEPETEPVHISSNERCWGRPMSQKGKEQNEEINER